MNGQPLKRCGCGKIPERLSNVIYSSHVVHGNCCMAWKVPWYPGQTNVEAWNAAPRPAIKIGRLNPPEAERPEEQVCRWSKSQVTHPDVDSLWDTSCGIVYAFRDGGPKQNDQKFCGYCAGRIEVGESQP